MHSSDMGFVYLVIAIIIIVFAIGWTHYFGESFQRRTGEPALMFSFGIPLIISLFGCVMGPFNDDFYNAVVGFALLITIIKSVSLIKKYGFKDYMGLFVYNALVVGYIVAGLLCISSLIDENKKKK